MLHASAKDQNKRRGTTAAAAATATIAIATAAAAVAIATIAAAAAPAPVASWPSSTTNKHFPQPTLHCIGEKDTMNPPEQVRCWLLVGWLLCGLWL